jgi:hypothetical protein
MLVFLAVLACANPILPDHLALVVPNVEPTVPDAVDWRDVGAVLPIRNSGQNAAAYVVVDAVASAWAIKNSNNVTDIGIQELIDCSDSEFFATHNLMNKKAIEKISPRMKTIRTECVWVA